MEKIRLGYKIILSGDKKTIWVYRNVKGAYQIAHQFSTEKTAKLVYDMLETKGNIGVFCTTYF